METENKMAYTPINKLILQMSAPPLISMFLQYSYNLVDSMFVAKISEQALAAVSLSFPITTLMNALSVWIGVGVNVLIAGYLGQNRQKKADSAATLGLLMSVLVGTAVNIAALFVIRPYYAAFTKNREIFEYGLSYMQVCVYMQVPNMVHIAIQKCCRRQAICLPRCGFRSPECCLTSFSIRCLFSGSVRSPKWELPVRHSQPFWDTLCQW